MKLLSSILFVGWVGTSNGFVPSKPSIWRLPSETAILSQKVEPDQKTTSLDSETRYCIPLEEIGLDDLPKVGG